MIAGSATSYKTLKKKFNRVRASVSFWDECSHHGNKTKKKVQCYSYKGVLLGKKMRQITIFWGKTAWICCVYIIVSIMSLNKGRNPKFCFYSPLWDVAKFYDSVGLFCFVCQTMVHLVALLVPLKRVQWVGVHQVGFIMFWHMVEKLLILNIFFLSEIYLNLN